MIISKTPLRISLGGGGTDLPIFSRKYGGLLLTAAIDKYVYVIVRKNFDQGIRFTGYYNKEIASKPRNIAHPVIKAILSKENEFRDINDNIEIVVLSDLPASSGLGGSSSFVVGLYNALYALKKIKINQIDLAKKAWNLERVILKEEGGVQDQYIAALGGLKIMSIGKKDRIKINNIEISRELKKELEIELVLVDIGFYRSSSEVHKKTIKKLKKDKNKMFFLKEIKEIGKLNLNYFMNGKLDQFGMGMHKHWELKKKYGHNISSDKIEDIYNNALKNGALGGKVIGAGSGGFMMFYVPIQNLINFKNFLKRKKIRNIDFNFDYEGSKILPNIIRE